MGNQYSITVSDETARILENAKEQGLKVSQIIDAAVKTLGFDACARLRVMYRQQAEYLGVEE